MLVLITLVAFEALAVATAMPVAARQLGGLRFYGLAFSLFLTTSLFGIVVGGGWCDRVGARAPLVVALALFAGGLLLSGAAHSFAMLLVGRAVSGAGGGLEIVALFVVVAMVYPEHLQPRVFAAVSAAWVLPSVIGPPIAGFLATEMSWRAVFLVVPPLSLVPPLTLWPRLARVPRPGTAAASRSVAPAPTVAPAPEPVRTPSAGVPAVPLPAPGTAPAAREHAVRGPDREPAVPAADGVTPGPQNGPGAQSGAGLVELSLRGLALAGGAGLVQYGLQSQVERSALVALGGAVLLLAVSLPRLLPPGTLRLARGMPSLIVVRSLLTSAYFGAETFVPLMLIEQRRLSPAMAGLTLTAGAVGWAAGSWLQGRRGVPAGRITLLSVGGAVVGASTLLLVPTALAGVPVWVVPPVWGLSGLGMGLGVSSTSVLTLRLSRPGEEGRNSSGLQIGDALGSVLGIGAGGAVFAALHDPHGSDAVVFAMIWGGLGLLGMTSSLVALRVRTP